MNGQRHPIGLAVGLVLLVPQVVIAVVVVRQPIVVGLIGFAMTLGFVRLGTLGYTVLRERRPPVGRGLLFAAGAVATIAGVLLYGAVARAVTAAADRTFHGVVAPVPVICLNQVVIAVLGLWIGGIVLAIASIVGALRARRA